MTTIMRFVPNHRVAALVIEATSPLDLGAVTEVFGIDRGLAPRWYDAPALERHTVISSLVRLTCVIGPLIDVRAARFGMLI